MSPVERLDERLATSGVKVRCGTCGCESEWQRELKLPPQWSLSWVVVEGRSWAKYECEACKGKPREEPAKGSIEEWRKRLERDAPKKKRRKR